MTHRETTQLARMPLLLLSWAVRNGMDRGVLLEGAGLRESQLADPDARVPTACMRRLWRAVAEAQPDPLIGMHLGSGITAAELGLVGYTLTYSADLGDALRRLTRYVRIMSEAVQYELTADGDRMRLIYRADPSLIALRHPAEAAISITLAVASEITGTTVVPVSISLPTPAGAPVDDYRRRYQCPVRFDQPVASISFANSQLALPTVLADSTLRSYLDDLAGIRLAELDGDAGDDLVSRIRQAVWEKLPGGRPDLNRIADSLGLSPRTLQRRLAEEDTSFSAILDELRRDLSDEMLTDSRLAVSEVAFMLGYSEPSAFQRAFRRWHGVSPRRFGDPPPPARRAG